MLLRNFLMGTVNGGKMVFIAVSGNDRFHGLSAKEAAKVYGDYYVAEIEAAPYGAGLAVTVEL